MEYIFSIFRSSTDTSSNDTNDTPSNNTIEIINTSNKLSNKYSNELQIIDAFLQKNYLNNNGTPGGGGVHDPKDLRVKKLYQKAISRRIYNDFIEEIHTQLPIMLEKEMKRQPLTKKIAKETLRKYLYY